MNTFTTEYSKLYDEIHKNKDYDSDVKKLLSLIKEIPNLSDSPAILDFGCGTGKHLNILHNLGFKTQGYDPSESMLLKARSSFPEIPFTGDLETLGANYDVVISLFDVLSYQVSDLSASSFIAQILSKVRPNGAVILDYWNLDGVRKDPPQHRSRKFEANGTSYERIVSPKFDEGTGVTELEIEVKNLATSEVIYNQTHSIRAFNTKDIERIVGNRGVIKTFFDASDYKSDVTFTTWRAGVIIRPNS